VERPGPSDADRERARDLIVRHVDRVVNERPRLMLKVDYQQLTSASSLDFVVNADAPPTPGGQITCVAKQIYSWVLVSTFDDVEPSQVRAMMPRGYLPQLNRLLRTSGVRRVGHLHQLSSVAHWTLCRGRDGRIAVHLAYVPAYRPVATLMPWDLLSDEERRRDSQKRPFTIERFFQRSLTRFRMYTSLPGSIDDLRSH
jgi:hypothetical protein